MLKKPRILFCILLFLTTNCGDSDKELVKQGNELVNKIEKFKSENNRLPLKLEEMGINETIESPLFYEKKDSVNYIIWFGTSLGESRIYYSDKKEWDYRLRGMKKEK